MPPSYVRPTEQRTAHRVPVLWQVMRLLFPTLLLCLLFWLLLPMGNSGTGMAAALDGPAVSRPWALPAMAIMTVGLTLLAVAVVGYQRRAARLARLGGRS